MFDLPLSKILGGVIALLCVVALVFWIGWGDAADARDKAKDRIVELEDELELVRLDLEILETAAVERAIDGERSDNERRELEDASTQPSDDAATRRLRRLCVLRRQQGGVDGLPSECGRFGGEAGAQPARRGFRIGRERRADG